MMLMAGSGEGIVDAAAAGIIAEGQPVLYSASYANDPDAMQRALDDAAHLVLTDTNRRQARRWGTVRDLFLRLWAKESPTTRIGGSASATPSGAGVTRKRSTNPI